MSKVKIIAVLIAALALTVPASASAVWFVEGTQQAGSAALATTAAVDEATVLKAGGATIKCSGKTLDSVAPEIKAPNKIAASDLVFTECAAESPCSISKPEIKTVPVSAELTEQTIPADNAVFVPQTGTLFTTIKFEGEECALTGLVPVTGKVKATLPTGQEESPAQSFNTNVTEASGELKVGSNSATLKGSALFKLSTEKEWMFLAPGAPAIRMTRFAGNGNARRMHQCGFNTQNETCELRVQVLSIANAVELKFVADRFVRVMGNVEYEMVASATNPECKKGTLIGGVGAVCYVKIKYTGPTNPGAGQFVSVYTAEAEENGGLLRKVISSVALEAKE